MSDTEKSDERAYKIQVEIFHVLNQDYEFLSNKNRHDALG